MNNAEPEILSALLRTSAHSGGQSESEIRGTAGRLLPDGLTVCEGFAGG